MGPDCGTAIIDGVPLAFANRVPRGDIGMIGASGTGIQEISSPDFAKPATDFRTPSASAVAISAEPSAASPL